MTGLTVVVLTRNEAPRLARCLASVRPIADAIVVVDSLSTDATVAVARGFTDRVIVRDWPGRAAQTRFAVDQVTTDWFLQLDADEASTPELNAAIVAALAAAPAEVDGFTLDRAEEFLGRPIRCGFHGEILRLCRTARATMPDQRAHAPLSVPGRVERLAPPLAHHVDQPLGELFEKWMRRAALSARDYHDRGRRFSVCGLLWHPLATALRLYLLKGGFRDGVPGLIFCGLRATYCFARMAHLYALRHPTATS